jgi:hypothetical protein
MDENDLWCNYSGMPSPMSYIRCDECDEILYECKCKEKRMNKEREINELGDIVVNGKLTIQELYDYAKENGFENNTLYLIGKEEGNSTSNVYTDTIRTFGRGWTKTTALLKFEYKKEEQQDTCQG